MASGYTEEFFYSSMPERNDDFPPPYGEFIFRPPTRRPIVKTSKSFKDKKPKNKGKGPPSRMYATVRDPRIVPGRDPRIAPGHPLIHPDFITPQKLIPKIVPPQPKPVKPARSKSFNDNKRMTEQKLKTVDTSRTYRCQSFPVPGNSEDHVVPGFAGPHKVPYHPKQRLGLHEGLFHPPPNLREPSSPSSYNVGGQQGLLFGRSSGNMGYSGMYVPSNELGTSLTLTELNQSEDEENTSPDPKPQKKKSTVRQILSSLFSSKKSSAQSPSKTERKKCKDEKAKPVAKSLSCEITKEEDIEEKSSAASTSLEAEDSNKMSGRTGRLSAKIMHQNEKQDQIILELKKKNSCTGKDDLGGATEEHEGQSEMTDDKGVKIRETDQRECDNGVQKVARQSDIVDSGKASKENDTGEKLKKSHSVPSDLFKKKSRKSENVSGNDVCHKTDVELSKSLGEFIRMNQQKNEPEMNNTEGTLKNKQNDSPGI